MPRKALHLNPPAPKRAGTRFPFGVLLLVTAVIAAALGSGVTYLALRPALLAAHPSPPPSPPGASGAPSTFVARGNAAYDTKDWTTAIADYTRAIAGGLDDSDLRTDLGTAYRNARQPRQALEEYQAAQREDPRHENSLVNEGIVYAFDLNAPVQALTVWRQYLARFPQGRHTADVKRLIAQVQAHAALPPTP